jgi:hypothetical protein
MMMDWAIITLSSLAGASVVVGEFNLDATLRTLLFVVLSVIGIVVQGRWLRASTAVEKTTV